MNCGSDVKMAIDTKFNSILDEIQLSKLNFIINMTPYAAYITLKKTTLIDKHGVPSMPSPPVLKLLERSLREKCDADMNISHLKDAFAKCEATCTRLNQENKMLRDSLSTSQEETKTYKTNLECTDKETAKLRTEIWTNFWLKFMQTK